MQRKTCSVCGEDKGLVDFYAHPFGADGKMSKCKECHKEYVRGWYRSTKPARDAYERRRYKVPKRRAASARSLRALRARHPERAKAWGAVARAVRTGKLKRMPCEVCGSEPSQAHHEDYSKPLDVRWLCFKHHRELGHGQTVIEADKDKAA